MSLNHYDLENPTDEQLKLIKDNYLTERIVHAGKLIRFTCKACEKYDKSEEFNYTRYAFDRKFTDSHLKTATHKNHVIMYKIYRDKLDKEEEYKDAYENLLDIGLKAKENTPLVWYNNNNGYLTLNKHLFCID